MDDELQQEDAPSQEEVYTKIAAMNQAATPEQEKEVDKRFSACWDWLVENQVLFYRDTKERVYRYGKKSL